jgi:hypothetical protein
MTASCSANIRSIHHIFTYIMIFREHMQLVLGLSGFECPEGEKGIFLEEGVSEIQDEDVGLGIVLAQPVLCHEDK